MNTIRLAWLATHPIQYQAPLLRAINNCADIDLTVLFFSDFSTRGFVDKEFGRVIEWDTALLDGYRHEFLPGTGSTSNEIQIFRPRVGGLASRLKLSNYDVVLVQGWQHYGMIKAAWLAKRNGLIVLMRCEATDHVSTSRGMKKLLREAVVSFLLKQVDYCLGIGSLNRDFYISRRFSPEHIGAMPYCVDNDYFRSKSQDADTTAIRSRFELEPGKPIILYASKLMKRKYPDLLLEAYHRLPEPRPYLVYVGDGELHGKLKQMKAELGLDDVRFAGFQNQSEMPAYYALADIFVLPSVNENWGLVINEAMNAGCAIITTDQVGCAKDLIKSGENGFIVPANDLSSLTGAIVKCIEKDRYLLMGAKSLEIINNWGIKENISGLRQILGLSDVC